MGSGAKLAGVRGEPFAHAAHLLGLAAAVMVLVWCIHFRGGLAFEASDKFLIFNIHPVLMLIGFIVIGSEAILSYRVLPWSKETRKLIHLILHGIAIVLGVVGIYATFKFHNEMGIDNLYSLHSWVGIGTISLYAVQWIYSFITFFFPGAGPRVREGALPWHLLFGVFVYALALVSAELGFIEKLTFMELSGLKRVGDKSIGSFLRYTFTSRYKEMLSKAHCASLATSPRLLSCLTKEESQLFEAARTSMTAFRKWRVGESRLERASILGRKRKSTMSTYPSTP